MLFPKLTAENTVLSPSVGEVFFCMLEIVASEVVADRGREMSNYTAPHAGRLPRPLIV